MLSLRLSYLYPYKTFTKCAILFSTCIFLKSLLNIYDILSGFSSVQENMLAVTLSVPVLGISVSGGKCASEPESPDKSPSLSFDFTETWKMLWVENK